EPINEFAKAGAFLGQLDYSKSAKHWGDCDALELDASGKLYKNATGGGRAIRIAMAHYLFNVYQNGKK
ncbi:hypothetical protein CGK50_23135, partial [Vibrio parahaemolyticus]